MNENQIKLLKLTQMKPKIESFIKNIPLVNSGPQLHWIQITIPRGILRGFTRCFIWLAVVDSH